MKKCIFISFLLVLTINSFSQFRWKAKPEEIPLVKFLQENFDSTVVYSPPVFFNSNKDRFWIVSKKGNDFTFSVYENLYRVELYKSSPQLLAEKFFKLDTAYRKALPDTNIYFHPFVTRFQKIKEPWSTIIANNLWALRDNIVDEKCNELNFILDGTYDVFYLITKSEIKRLSFGPMQLSVECCTMPEIRKNILNIIQSFKSVFTKPDIY